VAAQPGAASRPPPAVFVAVAGAPRDGEFESRDLHWRERRALQRRLKDSAVDEALSDWPFMLAALGLPLVAAAWSRPLGAGLAAWLLLTGALVLSAAWAARAAVRRLPKPGRDTRAVRRWLLSQGAGVLLLLSLQPWLVNADAARVSLVQPLLSAAALVLAMALAPLGRAVVVVAAVPVSAGLAQLLRSDDGAVALSAGGAYFAAALATAAVGLLLHDRWRRSQLAMMQRDDRIRSLEQACEAAERADQEKSRFLAIASHDLRQPVHALGLFAATLEKRLQGSDEEPLVRNVMRSIDGLERSFNAMLDISRLDAGTVEPNIQQFPLRDVFRRLHMHYAGQAEAAGLGLRFSPGGKSVSSDPQLLERILGNLIQNALKYTEQGGVVVVARSTATHTNLEVWDTGVGIRGPELPRIFEEFYQVGHGERSRSQGLGMGLAIVKRLAHLLGYRLTVVSRPGRGTMFRLSIPVGGLPEIQDVTAAADTLPMSVMQPRSVLVIDDEEPIREGLRILLEEWGYCAVVAASAAEAEHTVQALQAPPDLILSDLHLGEGPDGIAAIEAVRQRLGHEVPAILVTGDTSHQELRRCTESGHTVLFKPLQARKLFNVLRGMVT
jgi:signal transduction histidine kinase